MEPISYTVTVEATTEHTETTQEWRPLEDRPLTKEEADNTYHSKEGATKIVYGYAPERQIVKRERIKLFEQTVTDLDMEVLVLAVNGITVTTPKGAE